MAEEFVIAIPVYEQVDLLDIAAPKEVFKWMADLWDARSVQVHLVAETTDELQTRDGTTIRPGKTFKEVPRVDLLWVPGGDPSVLTTVMKDPAFTEFLVDRSENAEWVTSVCEGALVAANAGIFDGYEVTTHWKFIPCLRAYPKVNVAPIVPDYPRYWRSGNRVTGGGISSGLDESLYLVKLICGKEIAEEVQVSIQYFPDPPVCGQIPGTTSCMVEGLPVKAGSY